MESLKVIELDDTRHELAPQDDPPRQAAEAADRPARVRPDERRQACRYPAVVRRAEALRIGAQEVRAEIVDESATGFLLSVESDMEFSVGQKILLENESLWLELEVVHMQKISDTQTRLGVRRLRELSDSEIDWQESARFCWANVKILAAPLRMLARPVGTIGGLIVGAPFLLILLIWIFDHLAPLPLELTDTPGQYEHETPPPPKPRSKPHIAKHMDKVIRGIDNATGSSAHSTERRHPVTPASPRRSPPVRHPSAGSAIHADDPTPRAATRTVPPERLLEPEMIERLGLTEEQLDRLRQIADETHTDEAATENGASDSAAATDPTAADRALDNHEQGMQVLTEEQRGALTQSLSENPSHDSNPAAPEQPSGASAVDGE